MNKNKNQQKKYGVLPKQKSAERAPLILVVFPAGQEVQEAASNVSSLYVPSGHLTQSFLSLLYPHLHSTTRNSCNAYNFR